MRRARRGSALSDLRWKLKWLVKAVTPPIIILGVKTALIRLGLRRPDEQPLPPEPVAPEPEPEWEYVPEGWARTAGDPSVKGWDVAAVGAAYREKWPGFVHAIEGARPLGVYHEVATGEDMTGEDPAAHNLVLSFAYVAALAAHRKDRLVILDWGGGLGHYGEIARAVLPVEVDYHCKEVDAVVAAAREAGVDGRFVSDDSWRDRSYDLVLASGSLQYAEDWRAQLADLAAVCSGYLFVTRLPYARTSPSFHVLQRAVSLRLRDRVRRLGREPGGAAGARRRARARAGARARPRRLALGRGRAGRSDRPQRVPVQGQRRLRGSRTLIRPSKSHVSSTGR